MDIFTQSQIKNGDVDYWQASINGFVPGYKWGLGLNYLNNNKNSWLQGNFNKDFYKNIFKTRVSALMGAASQYYPNVQTHGTALTSFFELWNQGLGNINDKMTDDEFSK